jgi:hypothetical protein
MAYLLAKGAVQQEGTCLRVSGLLYRQFWQ